MIFKMKKINRKWYLSTISGFIYKDPVFASRQEIFVWSEEFNNLQNYSRNKEKHILEYDD